MLRPAGYILIVDPEAKSKEYDTFQCNHCGGHHVVRPGSGNKHRMCLVCYSPIHDNPQCASGCNPIERRMDLYEKGKTLVL